MKSSVESPVAADTTASAAANASAAAAGLPLPPLRLQPPLASLLGDVERGDLCRRATDAGAGAGAMELSVGAVFTWVLRLWEDELRRGLTVSELRVRQLADVGLTLAWVLSAAPASTRPLAAAPPCYLWSPTDCMMPETPRPSPLAITPISLHF